MWESWDGNWTDCNIFTPSSFVFSSTSFSFCWAASSFHCILFPTYWLQQTEFQLTQLSVAPGYIIVWPPPASCERHICTQFNPSTVKVIPWYLRPDAPVIYTGAFLIWQLGRGSICYRVIPKTQKMVLDGCLLNTQHYKVRIKGKVEQSRERSSALPYNLV